MIHVEGLVKTYTGARGSSPVLAANDVTFSVDEGAFYTLLGPSGCGKTTTLRCVAGLERADQGVISLDGKVVASPSTFVPANRRDIGMVFQSYAVWPHLSVFDNVAFPLRFGRSRARGASLRQRVGAALELVGLEQLGARRATQLSGGQQQRLALARALVSEPKVLLLDEPLSNLDAKLREKMRSEIRLIQRRVGITTLFVTHDQIEALSMSDKIAVMNSGRIVQEGSPKDVYFDVQSSFVADFIGSTNLVPGTIVREAAEGHLTVEAPFGRLTCRPGPSAHGASETVTVAIRPEDVQLVARSAAPASGGAQNRFPGIVRVDLFGGTFTDFFVELGGGQVVRARTSSRLELERDGPVDVMFAPAACRVLPEEATAAAPDVD